MKTILLLLVCSGTLLAFLSIPLILHKIKPNSLYGFRVKQTLENPGLWYAVNAYAGWRLLIVGLSTILSAIGFYLLPDISLDAYAYACLGVTSFFLLGGLVQSFLYMKKIGNK